MILAAVIIAIVVLDAWLDAKRIRRHKPIRHGIDAALYAAVCAALAVWFQWYHVAAMALLGRIAFFDITLNWFRGLPWTYNGAGGSLVDRLENKLRLNPTALRISGIIAFITYLTLLEFYENG